MWRRQRPPPPVGGGGPVPPRGRLPRGGGGLLLRLAPTPLVALALFFSLNGGGATASLEGSSVGFEYVVVDAGQSLWQLAESIAPASDPREVIDAIVRLNQLESTDVYAGQELAIPSQYVQ